MPIPGSILGTVFDPRNCVSMYPSVANLWPLVKTTDTTGQEIHTFSQSTNPAQLNLACRKSPLIIVRPQDQEQGEGEPGSEEKDTEGMRPNRRFAGEHRLTEEGSGFHRSSE